MAKPDAVIRMPQNADPKKAVDVARLFRQVYNTLRPR